MNTLRHSAPSFPSRARSAGVALVVALIFLLVLTLLGVSSLQGNIAQERMTYAFADYTRAFQAADSAITQGEYWLAIQSVKPIPCSGSCSNSSQVWATTGGNGTSQFALTSLYSTSWWNTNGLDFAMNYTQDGSSPTNRTYSTLSRVGGTTRYVIEEMGQDPNNSLVIGVPTYKRWYYRISGHGSGALGSKGMDASTQSTYVQGYGL